MVGSPLSIKSVRSVESDEDDEALGLGFDIEDNSRNEEGRRNGRGEGVSERGGLSRVSVTAASEGGDVGGFSWPSSRASVTAASEGAAAEGGGGLTRFSVIIIVITSICSRIQRIHQALPSNTYDAYVEAADVTVGEYYSGFVSW
jgi:hypothetical protein